MRPRAALLLALTLSLIVIGCAGPVRYTPEPFEVAVAPSLSVQPGLPLAVRFQASDQVRVIEFIGGATIIVDDRETTGLLAALVSQEFEKLGAQTDEFAEKVLDLSVVHVDLFYTGSFQCYFDIKVETGDDYVRGYVGNATSIYWRKACNAAIASAAALVVNDTMIRRYVGGD